MSQRPWKAATRIRFGLRAALRRRYAYAALRALRRAAVDAWQTHGRRSLGAELLYNGVAEADALITAYTRALARLQRRWPRMLDYADDERAKP